MADEKVVRKLRKKLEKALDKKNDDRAIKFLNDLQEADPTTPRWAHKRGDLLRKAGRQADAANCYATAVDLYADAGFLARAIAMAKMTLTLDPSRIEVLERVDPEAAQALHHQERPSGASGHPDADGDAEDELDVQPPALVADDSPDRDAGPPAIIEDRPEPSRGHRDIIDERPRRHRVNPLSVEDGPPPADKIKMRSGASRKKRVPTPPAQDAAKPEPTDPQPRRRKRKLRVRHKTLDDLALPVPMETNILNAPAPGEDVADLVIPSAPRLPGAGAGIIAGIQELTIDPDARPNETRFSNAPPAKTLELDVTELEFESRDLVDARASLPPQPSAQNLSKLPLFPLFSQVPRSALAQLMRESDLLELEDGAQVVRSGEDSDALYGIVEGNVRVSVPGQQISVLLAEGDVFGESCLLSGEKRQADVVVEGNLTALKIPQDVLNALIQEYPGLAEVLLELLTRRLLANLLQASPLFQEFDGAGRRGLAKLFEIRRAPANTILAEAGKHMDALYITLTGHIDVSTKAGGAVTCHGSGSMFGQSSLLENEPSQITVACGTNMILLRLPKHTFTKVAMQYPAILASLSELSGSDVVKVST